MSDHNEPLKSLDEKTKDMTRALWSLIEEIEAIQWYNERVDVITSDPELRDILVHNRNDEMEHFSMLLEWVRRNLDHLDEEMKTYLFTKLPVTVVADLKGDDAKKGGGASGLNIGSMKGKGE
jgi:hypothetical protein